MEQASEQTNFRKEEKAYARAQYSKQDDEAEKKNKDKET